MATAGRGAPMGNAPYTNYTGYQPAPIRTGTQAQGLPVKTTIRRGANGVYEGEDEEYGESTEENLAVRDKYNAQAEARRQATLRALMESSGGSGTPGAGGGNIPYDEEGARNAAFARAKDRAGQTARASLNALREQMGNNLGGAMEQQRTAEVIGGAAGSLGEFERDQLIMDLDRAGDISDRNYAGQIEREKMADDRRRSLYALFSEGKGPIY